MYIHVYPKKFLFLCIALMICIKAETNKEDYFTHQIKPGESVSLICIDYYGNYSNNLDDAIKESNPSIKDINLIIAGGKLKLRKPQTASKKKDTSPSIFTKKVNITQGVVTCVVGKALLLKKGGDKKNKLTTNTLVLPGDKICRFELSLPTAIAGVYGTVYETSVAGDSTTEVKVYNGEVSVKGSPRASMPAAGELMEVPGPSEVPGPHEVTMDEWVRIVRSMQKVTIDKNGTPSEVNGFKKDPSSSWEKWNEERDRLIAKILSEK